MQQLVREIGVYKNGHVNFFGVDMGSNKIRLVGRDNDPMSLFDTDSDTLVFSVPGHAYFAARWRQGYCPAHYLVYLFERKEETEAFTLYYGVRLVATIPLRKGAKQTS